MLRTLVLAAGLFAAFPALAEDPPAAPADGAPTEETVEHIVFEPLHVKPEQMAEWMPADNKGLQSLQKAYAAFCEGGMTQNEEANLRLLMEDKPGELGALQDKAMAIVAAGEGNNPSAAAFVLANAFLAYADLVYALRPTERMKEKQAEKFWVILETEVWPSFKGVDADAKAYFQSIEKGANASSPFKARSTDMIAKMAAAGRGEPVVAPPEAPAPEAPAPEAAP